MVTKRVKKEDVKNARENRYERIIIAEMYLQSCLNRKKVKVHPMHQKQGVLL